MDFGFKGQVTEDHLRELSRRAAQFTDYMSQYFPAASDERIDLDDIDAFKVAHNIVDCWEDFGQYEELKDVNVEGMDFRVEDQGRVYHLVILDRKILDLDDDTEMGRQSCDAALKETYLHELSHMVLKHQGAFTFSDDASPDIMSRMFWRSLQFFKDEKVSHLDAELMATVIGFWPTRDFTSMFRTTCFNMREIANSYKMTVESSVQWALIQYHDSLHMHYVKRLEHADGGRSELVSTYGLEGDVDVFQMKHSAASDAYERKADADSTNKVGEYACRAFYEKKCYAYGAKSDFIIVLGRKRNNYFDGDDPFAGRIEVSPSKDL